MAIEKSEWWYCDWHASRDKDKAAEPVDHGIEDDPRNPDGWLKITVERIQANPDYLAAVDAFRREAVNMLIYERGDTDPPTDEEKEGYTLAALAMNPIDIPPVEVEVGTYCLSPERAGWLSVAGIPGYGGDPAKVLTVAAAQVSNLTLPSTDDLVDAFMGAVEWEAVVHGISEAVTGAADGQDSRAAGVAVLREAARAGLDSVLAVIRGTHTGVTAEALEKAIQRAINTTNVPEEG